MAANRTGAVATSVEEQQDAGGVAIRDDRPFARPPVEIYLIELDVLRHGPVRADFIEARPPYGPADRAGLELSRVRTASISL
jgi:hypothetical protein